MKTYSETKTRSSSFAFYAFSGGGGEKSTSRPVCAQLPSLPGGDSAPEENGAHQAGGMRTSNLTLETDVLKERKWGTAQARLSLG